MNAKYPFLENVDTSLTSLEEKPQFGAPPFPWEAFEKSLKKRFQLKDLQISHNEKGWVKQKPEGEILTFYVSSINIPFYWSMTSKDRDKLFESFFSMKEEASHFLEKPLAQGLYQFIAVAILKEIDHLEFAEQITFNLGANPGVIEDQNFYRIDISIKEKNNIAAGSLFFPSSFRNEWKKHFAKYYKFYLSDDLKKKLAFDIGLEIGYSQINVDEIKKAKLGDCILLDHSSYDTEKKEGSVVLTLNGEGIFRGKLKENGIKLLEFPRLEEARKIMDTENNFEPEEEAFLQELPDETNISKMENLPLQVSVEVGRLKMTLEELSNLSSGSLIELPINVDEGVDLVINGRKIGKGDLVKIGESLGVRITKL